MVDAGRSLMGSPSLRGGQRLTAVGAVTASSTGTAPTAGSANVKGSYTELIASTAHDAHGIVINLMRTSAGGDYLVDIAIGGAGSEQIIVADLLRSTLGATFSHQPIFVPIYIPAGSRISARIQSTTGSATFSMIVTLVQGGDVMPGSEGICVTYGAASGDSGGTSIDPGGSANTKGSYSQITASTTRPIHWLIVAIGGQGNAARTSAGWLMDIAIGGGGSEQVIVPNIPLSSHGNTDEMFPQFIELPVCIPAGSRLAVRAQSGITDATDRLFDVILYGVG